MIRTIQGILVSKRLLAFFASTVCLALFIIFFGKTFASDRLNEVGDFAANSMLVEDAKHLHLLVGNYSRVGFNHPGPAFLYVLAAGELIFFDVTRIVNSALSGQILAIALLSSFWIASIGTLMCRLQASTFTGIVTTALFVGITGYINYQAFLGPWFPHLYYFPFATFTVAIAALIMGRRDGLILLAISWGFLVNGHVSFVGITAIMLLCALGANTGLYITSRIDNRDWVLSREYLSTNSRTLLLAVVIAGMFLVPLAVQTIIHFPGPVAQYVAFGRAHHLNRLGDSIRFIGGFWNNGLFGLLFGAAACSVFVTGNTSDASRSRVDSERAFALSLVCASIAFLLYATFGVDNLSFTYIGIFYYSIPAFAIVLLLLRTIGNCTTRPSLLATTLVCVFVGVFSATRIHQAPEYAAQYNDSQIPSAYAAIEQLGSDPLVFDLDGQSNWELLWTTLVGIEVYAKRHGSVPFCIAENWQIVFTEQERCTTDEIGRAKARYLVSTSPQRSLTNTTYVDGLYFYRVAMR